MKEQLIPALQSGSAGAPGLYLQDGSGSEAKRDSIRLEVSADFFDTQAMVQEHDVQVDLHAKSVDGFAWIDPDAAIGVEIAHIEQPTATGGAVCGGPDLAGDDALSRYVFYDNRGNVRAFAHVGTRELPTEAPT